jgi:hypothetical protein
MEKSAEAVVVHQGKTPRGGSLAGVDEGPNLLTQGADRKSSMQTQRQTNPSFWEMLEKLTPKQTRHEEGGAEVVQPSPCVEPLITLAHDRDRALTFSLMEQVVKPANQRAW